MTPDIPPFYCPIPYKQAPGADLLDQNSVKWMDKLNIYRDRTHRDYLARTNVGLFAALAVPDGPLERRQVQSDLFLFSFALDDALFDERNTLDPRSDVELARTLMWLDRTLQAPEARPDGDVSWLVAGLDDIRRRVAELATPLQYAQWVSAYRSYFLDAYLELALRTEPLSLNDYTTARLGDGAMQMLQPMIAIVGGYELGHDELADPRVRALADMCSLITMWDNDMLGAHKERYRAEHYDYVLPDSLLSVLAKQRRCSPEEAIPHAMALRDTVMCRFDELQQDVLADARDGEPLARYVTGLGQWLRGYLDWALTSTRYRDPRNPGDTTPGSELTMPTTWASHPAPHPDRLDLPTLAWWFHRPMRGSMTHLHAGPSCPPCARKPSR